MDGIAEMFAELNGYDAYETAIEEWGAWRQVRAAERDRAPVNKERRRVYLRAYRAAHPEFRAANVERTRQWRKANAEHVREIWRQSNKKQRERAKTDPVYREKYLAIKRRAWRKQKQKNLERYRAMNREAARRRRARLKAQKPRPHAA